MNSAVFDVLRELASDIPRRGYTIAKHEGKFNSRVGDLRVKMIADDEMKIRRGKHFHQMLHRMLPHFSSRVERHRQRFHRNYTGTRRGWIASTRSALIGYMETSYSIGIIGGGGISSRGDNAVQTIIKL